MQRPQPSKIEINGTELHYVEQGQGDPVVFVHGGLGDFRTWLPQVATFSERYRAIAYSRRAHYPNHWPSDYTRAAMQLHVDDLCALIQALELEKAHLVGNSYGAYICLVLALQQPSLVRSLSLAEPPIHPLLLRIPGGQELFDEFVADAWEPARGAFAKGDLHEGVRLFIEGAVGKRAWEELPPRVRQEMMKNGREMGVATQTELKVQMLDFSCEDAAKIHAPALLLRGALSPKKYYLINDELARCMPHAKQATIPNAAHVLHSHNPEAHDRIVLNFIAQQ